MNTEKWLVVLCSKFGVGVLAALVSMVVSADPIAYSADGSNLVEIDIATGASTVIGPLGINEDTEALAVDPTTDILYLATDSDSLYTIDTGTGAATLVGPLGVTYTNGGLSFDPSGTGYLVTSNGLFVLDKATGAATLIASDYGNVAVTSGLSSAAFVGSTLYAGPDNGSASNLYSVDVTTGVATTVGPLGFSSDNQTGLTYDAYADVLYMLDESTAGIYAVDYASGAATLLSTFSGNFEALALADPGNPAGEAATEAEPVPLLPAMALFALCSALGVTGASVLRRR